MQFEPSTFVPVVLGLVTGLWLMYLTFATVLDVTSGYTWPKA